MPKCYISLTLTNFNGKNNRVTSTYENKSDQVVFLSLALLKSCIEIVWGNLLWLSKGVRQDDLQSPFQSQLFHDSVKSTANAELHQEHLKYNLRRLHIFILLVMWLVMFTEIYFCFLEYSLEKSTIYVIVSLQNSDCCFHSKFT